MLDLLICWQKALEDDLGRGTSLCEKAKNCGQQFPVVTLEHIMRREGDKSAEQGLSLSGS